MCTRLAFSLSALTAAVLMTMPCAPALAQSVPLPGITNIAGVPACASSANGTGHMICLVANSAGTLSAVSVQQKPGFFPTPPLNSTSVNPNQVTSTGPNNPLALGISGTVGSSSCSSTADITGDTVCAYNANGSLRAVRFNIFSNPDSQAIYPVENLNVNVVGNASCTLGRPRFSNIGPYAQPATTVAAEGPAGDIICAFRSTNNELLAVGFNPAEPAAAAVIHLFDLNVQASGDPSCTFTAAANSNNPVICAFVSPNGLQGIGFDPRTPSKTPLLGLYAGTAFSGDPGCAAPDNSGSVTCAIRSAASTLVGFSFNPQAGSVVPATPQPLGGTALSGRPSCANLADGSNTVVCGVHSSGSVINSVRFDPRAANIQPTFVSSGLVTAGDVSCVFLNISPNQLTCSGLLPTQGELFDIILSPLNPGVKALTALYRMF